MWISSVVVTAASGPAARDLVPALRSIPALTPGELQGLRLPVVIEAPDGGSSRYWHQWLEQLPGVIHVEVAFVSFDETGQDPGDAVTTAGVPQHE